MNAFERELFRENERYAGAREFFRPMLEAGAGGPWSTVSETRVTRTDALSDEAAGLALRVARGDDVSLLALFAQSLGLILGRCFMVDGLTAWLDLEERSGGRPSLPLRFPVRSGGFAKNLVEARGLIVRAGAFGDFDAAALLDGAASFRALELCVGKARQAPDRAPADVSAALLRTDKGLALELSYKPSCLPDALATAMAGYLSKLWANALADPQASPEEPDFIPAAETERILDQWSRRGRTDDWSYPEKNLATLFEETARAHADRVAIKADGRSLTYAELERASAVLATRIIKVAGGPGKRIGLLADRSAGAVVALLGAIRAGCAYVPLDPDHPAERTVFMAKDASLSAILHPGSLAEAAGNIAAASGVPALLDYDGPERHERAELPVPSLDDAAYVIYTSGTTGAPKGCELSHRNVARLMKARALPFSFTERDVWSLFHSFCFDFSVWEIWGALLYGGTLAVAGDAERADPSVFRSFLEAEGVTVLSQTPTAFYRLAEACRDKPLPSVREVVFGGEALKSRLLAAWSASHPGARLVNMYGITETTVHVTWKVLGPDDLARGSRSVGTALPTLRVFLLDAAGRVQPAGAVGEICVEGLGLATGYINQPELTATRFAPNPHTGERLYRSGDLGRWTVDGEIEYLGRRDSQVKIRGHRIERGEVESAAARHDAVSSAACAARTDKDGDSYLALWYAASRPVSFSEMRAHLAELLPAYMVPSAMVQVDALPCTANGKVDLSALPDPERRSGSHGRKPDGELEEAMARAWGEVLGVESPGMDDNFFECGGDSIKAMQIAARLNDHGLSLDVKELFRHPTLDELKPYVRPLSRIPPQEAASGPCPLSPIQERFFSLGEAGMDVDNQAMVLRAPGGFDREALASALNAVFERHDAFRLRFTKGDGGVWSSAYADARAPAIQEFPKADDAGQALLDAGRELNRPFDLGSGPLLRFGLVPAEDGDYLAIVAHHLVMDGVSWRIVLEDLGVAYAQAVKGTAASFPLRSDSYAAWAGWLRGPGAEQAGDTADAWLAIGQDRDPWPAADGAAGSRSDARLKAFSLDPARTEELLTRAWKAYYAEPRDLILAALELSLPPEAGEGSLVIDMEGHGRDVPSDQLDVSRTVGWFTSIYPVRLPRSGGQPGVAVREAKEAQRGLPPHQSWGVLKYILGHPAAQKRRSGILFNFHGEVDGSGRSGDFEVADLPLGALQSPERPLDYPLELNLIVRSGRLHCVLKYDSTRLERAVVDNMSAAFRKNLDAVIGHCLSLPEAVHTPSDFGLSGGVDSDDLAVLAKVAADL
ncbi:MAG: amino acid adenylation domain-containing protein [Spirochaetales bacterium]|nr:amino acid adenylation domain-containing protein [Spirochaetales bacterium]